MPSGPWFVGWDVGGAHLKVALADADGRLHWAAQYATPLWEGLHWLHGAVRRAAAAVPPGDTRHAVTMTGELVDQFPSRRNGVTALVAAMEGWLPGAELRFYAGPRGWVDAAGTEAAAPWIASANWHASASLVARTVGDGLFVDVGSTTTDLVPLRSGVVAHRGYGDRERMAVEELVYTGVSRTPLMSLAERVPVAGEWVGLAAEQFAHTADVYRLLGRLPEAADLDPTADGRGKGGRETVARIARMVGMDGPSLEPERESWLGLARFLEERQLDRLGRACARQVSTGIPGDAPLVGAGIGRFLVRRLAQRLERPYHDMDGLLPTAPGARGLDASDCAPAAAMAVLAALETTPCPC